MSGLYRLHLIMLGHAIYSPPLPSLWLDKGVVPTRSGKLTLSDERNFGTFRAAHEGGAIFG